MWTKKLLNYNVYVGRRECEGGKMALEGMNFNVRCIQENKSR